MRMPWLTTWRLLFLGAVVAALVAAMSRRSDRRAGFAEKSPVSARGVASSDTSVSRSDPRPTRPVAHNRPFVAAIRAMIRPYPRGACLEGGWSVGWSDGTGTRQALDSALLFPTGVKKYPVVTLAKWPDGSTSVHLFQGLIADLRRLSRTITEIVARPS